MHLAVEGALNGCCASFVYVFSLSVFVLSRTYSHYEVKTRRSFYITATPLKRYFPSVRDGSSPIVSGISYALAGPSFGSIPPTHHGVAERVVVSTDGSGVQMPEYERGRTLFILRGVARMQGVVDALLGVSESSLTGPTPASTSKTSTSSTASTTTTTTAAPYTPTRYPNRHHRTRVNTRSTRHKRHTHRTIPRGRGPQRAPGMIVVGWSVLSLWGDGAAGERVLDEGDGNEGARGRGKGTSRG